MKKIAIALGRAYMGGTTEVAKSLGIEFSKMGYQVAFFILDKKAPGKSSLESTGLPVHQIAKPFTKSWTRYLKEIGSLFSEYDGLILNGSFARVAHAGLEFISPNVATINIFHGHPLPDEAATHTKDLWYAGAGVNPNITASLHSFYGSTKKFRNVFNGVLLPKITNNLTGEEPLIRLAYVGRVQEKVKRVSMLYDICQNLFQKEIPFHLDIVGDGHDKERLQSKFTSAPFHHCITFHGKVSHENVYQILSNCHALLLPSSYESFGLVLAEAQAIGVVPITTLLSGITDQIIEDRKTGFLCQINNLDSYVDPILFLHNNKTLWSQISQDAKKSAWEKFSSAAMAKNYEALFLEYWSEAKPIPKHPLPKNIRFSILAWPASNSRAFLRKYRFWAEDWFGRICEYFRRDTKNT